MWNAFGIFLLLGFGFVIFIPPLGYVLFFLAFILFCMAIIHSFIQASKPSKQASQSSESSKINPVLDRFLANTTAHRRGAPGESNGEFFTAESEDSKTCPMCAESVKKAAKICRYCGHEFDGESFVDHDPQATEEAITDPTISFVVTDDELAAPREDSARAPGIPLPSRHKSAAWQSTGIDKLGISGLGITRGVVLVALVLLIVSVYLGRKSLLNQSIQVDEQNIGSGQTYAELVKRCTDAEYTGVEYGVTSTIMNVLMGPGPNYVNIINQNASTLHKTDYIQIDKSFKVYEVCRMEGWSFIEVVKPTRLRDSYRGWVESHFLRGQLFGGDAPSKKTSQINQQSTNSSYDSYQQSSTPGATLVKRCSTEAGIPANEPKHVITPQEMSRLASCLDR